MKHLRQIYLAAATAGILPLGSLHPALADTPKPEPAALSQLQTMVTNLGYSTVLDKDNQAFAIQWTGDYNYKIHFYLSNDNTLAFAYVDVETLSASQMAKLQFVKLMEENDIGDFYFSMESHQDGETLYADTVLPVSGLTPQKLRGLLQNISDKLSDTSDTWDTSTWK